MFLRYSRAERPADTAFLPLRVEGEVFMALQDTDVTVPRTLAVHPEYEAMLSERISGENWFYRIQDPDEQVRVAQDFIRNLAGLHRLDPHDLELPSFGPVKTAREHALDEIGNMRRRVTTSTGHIDPLVRLSLDWLERNVPEFDGPVVLVQGDTGPGNFMYENGKVTAVVDWELAHLGDPMDDIAWLSLRTVQDTFTHFPDRLREYEELSGNTIDPSTCLVLPPVRRNATHVELRRSRRDRVGAAEGQPVARDIGNGIIYGMLHRRLTIEALANVMGFGRPRPTCRTSRRPSPGIRPRRDAREPPGDRAEDRRPFGVAVDKGCGARREVPERARPLRTCVRGRRARRRHRALRSRPRVLGGRASRTRVRVGEGAVKDEDYVRYLWRQVQRDDYLMRTASGALRERTWPPLFDT